MKIRLILALLLLISPALAQTGFNTGSSSFITSPQGRLTLTSGAIVQVSSVTAATTIYYDNFYGSFIFTGPGLTPHASPGEISMGLDAVTPHIASGSLYDIFAVDNYGGLALCAGPAWSSTSSRGTGAGTTQLQRFGGILTNAATLSHCWGGASGTTDYGSVPGIVANTAAYLGTFLATANGQTSQQFNTSPASGGGNTVIGVFNAYNRVSITANTFDNTSSWTYNSVTWRPSDNSTSNAVRIVDGLSHLSIQAAFTVGCKAGSSNDDGYIGINYNSTSATPAASSIACNNTVGSSSLVTGYFTPALGLNTITAMESGNSTSSVTFFGTGFTATGAASSQQIHSLSVQVVD